MGVVGFRLGVGGEARQGKKAKAGKAREGRIGQGENECGRWPIVGGKRKGSGSKLDLETD